MGEIYPDFKEHVDIEFVPFGRSKSLDDNGEKFECQHGPAECSGNKIQSCGLSKLEGKPDAQEAFVVCQMKQSNETTGKEVKKHNFFVWGQLLFTDKM